MANGGYWQMLAQQPDIAQAGTNFVQAFMAARQAKMQEQRAAQEQAMIERQQQRQTDLDIARRDYMTGNQEHLQQIAPEEYAQRQQLEAAQAQRAQQAEAQRGSEIEAKRQAMAERYYYAGNKTPMQQLYPQRFAELEQAKADREAKGLPQLDDIGKQVVLENGLRQGTPEFQRAYAAARKAHDAAALQRASASAGAGGKLLPATSVTEISDVDTAIGLLDELESEFDARVPNGNTLTRVYSRISNYVPNSDVQIYDKKAQLAAQKAGLVLEKGKLQASDFPRYLEMLTPRPGESREVAKAKIQNARNALNSMRAGSAQALQSAGYKVPSIKQGPSGDINLNEKQAASQATSAAADDLSGKSTEELEAELQRLKGTP